MQRLLMPALLCLLLFSKSADATSSAGAGEITYEWLTDSTYRFYFNYYNDCSGGSEPDSVQLCFYNPCSNSLSFSIYLKKQGSPTQTSGCSMMKTQCDSPSSIIPGYKKFSYTSFATLPARCNAWHIFTHVGNRNNSINIQNATSNQYDAEARFNNLNFQGNSSPYPTTSSIGYVFQTIPTGYTSSYTDPNGDSVVTEVINPLTNVTTCTDTVPSNATYTSSTPGLNNTNNPFQTNNTFVIDSHSGQMAFTAAQTGKNIIALRVKEYRNRVLIGYTTREIQFVSFTPPPHSNITTTFYPAPPNTGYQVCSGDSLTFDFDVVASDTNKLLNVTDNLQYKFPSAHITYTHQHTDSVRGHFFWVAGGVGPYSFILNTIDSTCTPPGIIIYSPISIPINVLPAISPLLDTTICLGDTARFNFAVTGTFAWSILPGGTPGSISCATCSKVSMYPTTTSSYAVHIAPSVACPVTDDTVTVNVKTTFTYPAVTITASPDTNIIVSTPVSFTAHVVNCAHPIYQWFINGILVPGVYGSTYTSQNLKDLDIITCELVCADSCPRPRDTISNMLTMHVTTGIEIISSSPFKVSPNPNNGSFRVVGKVQTNNTTIELLDITGKQMYMKQIATRNGEINEQLQLDLRPGIYILKIDNLAMRLVVE